MVSKWMFCSNRENRMRNYDLDMVKEIGAVVLFFIGNAFLFVALLAVFATQ